MTLIQNPAFPENTPLILLVEDNIIALRLVETIVAQAGCNHISTTNGEKALELAKTVAFELIITDIGLPGISGMELTSQIREWEKSLNKEPIPIIGLTAHTLHDSKSKCLQAGMDKVLSKPIYLDEMQELIFQFIKKNIRTLSEELKSELKAYALEQFPLFDKAEAIQNIGDERILKDLIILMVNKAIPEDMVSIEMAYKDQDWNKIEDLAHKMKSGALYCGTKKMQYACLYLERYPKNGNLEVLDKLYKQLIVAVNETMLFLECWLKAINEN
ncbi:MAG: response regulator [Tatlockia sp.]|nr:response regulator [Tatlockia sp.]